MGLIGSFLSLLFWIGVIVFGAQAAAELKPADIVSVGAFFAIASAGCLLASSFSRA